MSYELSSAFDPAIKTKESQDFPLVWFGIYDKCEEIKKPHTSKNSHESMNWTPSISQEAYKSNIAKIKQWLRDGQTYQMNYTFRLHADFEDQPYDLFCNMIDAQKKTYGAFIKIRDWIICSASPELFFELDGRRLKLKPMKGTVHRGLSYLDDLGNASFLKHSEKNRAENVMIVDMVRNDMAKIADTGSVVVENLFDVEKYPTLWQMTSSVICQTGASIRDIFMALFPAASITGAPKVRATELIAELEDSPRKIYTGAIGFIEPERKRAQFNVAIRTVLIDRKRKRAEYGVGGGIVWDSADEAEFDECCTKTRILRHKVPAMFI